MKKHGEDQPPKQAASLEELKNIANPHPAADIDTRYQDNKGTKENQVKKGNAAEEAEDTE